MNKFAKLLTASALALAVSPAFAQEPVATLQVEAGNVMTSEGGEFQTARTGEALNVGERIMLSENSVAVVRYSNGCARRYDAPGVYPVPVSCTPIAGRWSGQTDWASVGIGAGVFLAGVAVLASMDDVDGCTGIPDPQPHACVPPPISR